METIKLITSLSIIKTGEGLRLSYTYSVVDVNTGTIVKNNERASCALLEGLNDNIISSVKEIENFIKNREGIESVTK